MINNKSTINNQSTHRLFLFLKAKSMSSKYKNIHIAGTLAILISGCASHTHELKAADVSTAGYEGYTCTELQAETQSCINKITDLANVLNQKADTDETQAAVGLILLWPVLFALEGGDKEEAAEYSRLKGELNAMEQVAIVKECETVVELAKDFRTKEHEARLAREKKRQQEETARIAE